MKTTIKLTKLMTILLALTLPVTAMAISEEVYDFEVNGIYYKIVNNEACVTYKTHTYSSHTHNYLSDYTGDVVIPSTVTFNDQTYPVTTIGEYAFYRRSSLTSITIPSSVISINYEAFINCTGLTRVTITDVTAWCKAQISCNPLSYAQHLYLNDSEVTDLIIPDGITEIQKFTFAGCVGFTSVTISNSVTLIDENAFQDCTGLTSVSIGNSVTVIGKVAFKDCTALRNVTFGKSLKTIDHNAFSGCTALTDIEIPNSVTEIGSSAFSGCTALTSATFGKSVSTISYGAFKDCVGLTSIEIPNSVTEIGQVAFAGCNGLTSITLGNSVSTIGKDAFQNDPIIETFTCKATTPPIWEDISMFTTNVYNHTQLHVPVDCEKSYMFNLYWGQFQNIIGDVNEDNPSNEQNCDINGDGEISIADVNEVIVIIINGGNNGGHSRIPEEGEILGDVNGDSEVSLADVNAIIDVILSEF